MTDDLGIHAGGKPSPSAPRGSAAPFRRDSESDPPNGATRAASRFPRLRSALRGGQGARAHVCATPPAAPAVRSPPVAASRRVAAPGCLRVRHFAADTPAAGKVNPEPAAAWMRLHVRPVIVHAANGAARQARGLTDNWALRQPPPSVCHAAARCRTLSSLPPAGRGAVSAHRHTATRSLRCSAFFALTKRKHLQDSGHAQIKLHTPRPTPPIFHMWKGSGRVHKTRTAPAPFRREKTSEKPLFHVERGTHQTRVKPNVHAGSSR